MIELEGNPGKSVGLYVNVQTYGLDKGVSLRDYLLGAMMSSAAGN